MTGSRFLPVPLVVAAGFLLAMPISAAETLLVDEGGTLSTRAAAVATIGAEGQSPHAEAPPFRELMRRYPPESLAEALAEGIVSGHPDMPEYVLSPSEIEAVMAYLHTLSQP